MVAKELGIEGEDAVAASKLRDVEPQALSEALVAAGVRLPPIIDGWVIPKSPRAVFEAKECIELSRAILEKRAPQIDLQRTRSKESVDGKA